MKRFCLALALILLLSSAASAGGITCGVKAGINLADLTGDDIENNEMKLAFGGGIFCNFAITDVISIQPEVLFMMKGTKSSVLENTGYHFTYIDIPLLARFSVPTEGSLVPSFFGGPYLGFLMSATAERALVEEDIKESLKDTDYGLVFGAGLDYRVGDGHVFLDIRYSFGLTTIVDEGDEDAKNTGIMFMLGYGYTF
ncbi:MAG: PorT family protein [bacterium]|nr:MAG: PorT family protein [bacterium]